MSAFRELYNYVGHYLLSEVALLLKPDVRSLVAVRLGVPQNKINSLIMLCRSASGI